MNFILSYGPATACHPSPCIPRGILLRIFFTLLHHSTSDSVVPRLLEPGGDASEPVDKKLCIIFAVFGHSIEFMNESDIGERMNEFYV